MLDIHLIKHRDFLHTQFMVRAPYNRCQTGEMIRILLLLLLFYVYLDVSSCVVRALCEPLCLFWGGCAYCVGVNIYYCFIIVKPRFLTHFCPQTQGAYNMSVETVVNYRQTGVALMVLTLAAMTTKSQQATKDDYYNLTDDLFARYKKDIRPVNDDDNTTHVFITFYLYSIIDMNEQDQTMKTNGMLYIEWNDDYLSWEQSDYDNIDNFLVPQNSVWLPDIVVDNTVTTQTQLGYKELQVTIYSNGDILWLPTPVFETSCDFDVTYYPFDTQVCSVDFTSASYETTDLKLNIYETGALNTSKFSTDGIWDVVNTSASNNTDDRNDWRDKISFKLQLKRRPAFYVLSIILPVVFLAMTSSFVFALPAESGEKMSLSITLLLAFAVYLTLVSNDMPKTSVKMSVLMVYVTQLMALTTMSVILSVPLIKLYHRPSDKPLGTKATKVIVFLRKVMCMSSDQRLCNVAKAKTSSQNGRRIYIVNEQTHNAIAPCDNTHDNDCRSPSASRTERSLEVSPVSGEVASETISMFLFYIFFLYSIVVTIVYIVILINGGARQEESTRLN